MVEQSDSNHGKGVRKILIMGLANSGKSSILMCLQGIKNLASFAASKPTKGLRVVPFETLGSDFSIWDFGGQQQYLKDHITNFHKNLYGTNKLIYVIDIQDEKMYDPSLDYFKSILTLLNESEKKVEISIFLHKFDPDLDKQGIILDDEKIENLINQIKKLLPNEYKYKLFKTSIYTLFQKIGLE